MRSKKVTMITQAAIIAAIYVVLTFLANALGLAKFSIQVRFSESLCVLPYFTKAAIPGLYVGCLIANIVTGASIWDILFGSLATLIGAIGSYRFRKSKFLLMLCPILSNMVIVPFVIRYGYGMKWMWEGKDMALLFNAVTVGIGEVISIGVLGSLLLKVLMPYENLIFRQDR
uniref:QueT transporter family protein n=1 Tax=Agathobacter sp. TaxID=2021311 RepID=UPI004055D76B